MSYDTWDKATDAARIAGRELGRTIAAWQDVPRGDADQLINEATDAFKDAAIDAFRQASTDMSRTEPIQRIDLTAPSDHLTYVEILTPGGIVRVNTNLIDIRGDSRTHRPVVVVEVEPNKTYRPKTAAEDWDVDGCSVSHGTRFEVRLTRREET